MASAKLSERQVRRAEQRINEICAVRDAALRKKHTTPNEVITIAQTIKNIKNGTFKVIGTLELDAPMRRNYSVGQLFALPEIKDPMKFDHPAYEAELRLLHAERQAALDEVIFGVDAPALLDVLRKFELGS